MRNHSEFGYYFSPPVRVRLYERRGFRSAWLLTTQSGPVSSGLQAHCHFARSPLRLCHSAPSRNQFFHLPASILPDGEPAVQVSFYVTSAKSIAANCLILKA